MVKYQAAKVAIRIVQMPTLHEPAPPPRRSFVSSRSAHRRPNFANQKRRGQNHQRQDDQGEFQAATTPVGRDAKPPLDEIHSASRRTLSRLYRGSQRV